jgi:hypothetical protein
MTEVEHMTDAEWLALTDTLPAVNAAAPHVSDRKLRLFVIACCRRVWHMLPDDGYRKAVEVAERFCDGLATSRQLARARNIATALHQAWLEATPSLRSRRDLAPFEAYQCASVAFDKESPKSPWRTLVGRYSGGSYSALYGTDGAATAAAYAAMHEGQSEPDESVLSAERAVQCALLRDIVGTPQGPPSAVDPAWLHWQGGAVPKLAAGIYDERAFDRLPLLADALEDAGCADATILGHCRGSGEHVRGCWAVDLVLRRE